MMDYNNVATVTVPLDRYEELLVEATQLEMMVQYMCTQTYVDDTLAVLSGCPDIINAKVDENSKKLHEEAEKAFKQRENGGENNA